MIATAFSSFVAAAVELSSIDSNANSESDLAEIPSDDTYEKELAIHSIRDFSSDTITAPGSVSSVTSSIIPKISTLGDFSVRPSIIITTDAYVYNTSFGKYIFSKSAPYSMMLISYRENQTDIDSIEVVSATEFAIRSQSNISLTDWCVLEASDSCFVAQAIVIVKEMSSGTFTVSTNFSSESAPKITMSLCMLTKVNEKMGITWIITTAPSCSIVDDDNKVISSDMITSNPLRLNASKYAVDLERGDSKDIAKSVGKIDWSDAETGNASVGISESHASRMTISIEFPMGMRTVDPTVIGTSTLTYATPGTPFRNSFYCNNSYWVFWFTGSQIVYKRSNDGIDWSSASQNVANPPYAFPQTQHIFDVAAKDGYVLLAVNTTNGVYAIEGMVSGSSILWSTLSWILVRNGPIRVFNCALGLSAFLSAVECFIAVTEDAGSYQHITTCHKHWGVSSYYLDWTPFNDVASVYTRYLGISLAESSPWSIAVIVSCQNSPGTDRIYWSEYFFMADRHPPQPGQDAWGPLNVAMMSDMADLVPYELSSVALNDGTVIAAGKKYGPVGGVTKQYTGVWTLKRDGSAYYSGALDYGDSLSHSSIDDPKGRCALSKDVNDGLYLFYWSQTSPTSGYNLYYRYKLSPTADWSPQENLWAVNSGTYRYTTSMEQSGDFSLVSWTKYNGASYDVDVCSIPTLAKVLAASPDEWATPGEDANKPLDSHGSASVSPGSGQLFASIVDLSATGRQIDLSIGRYYSMPKFFITTVTGNYQPYMWAQSSMTDMGACWQLDFPWIYASFVHWFSGQSYLITWENNRFENKMGEIFTLYRWGSPYQYAINSADGSNYTFNSNGKLVSIQSDFKWNAQNLISFTYDGNGMLSTITDTIGRNAIFSYNGGGGNGKLKDITYAGKKVSFQYDASDRLWKVINEAGRSIVYTYASWFTDFPLISTIQIPDGAITKYTYGNLSVGTQAHSKMITKRSVCNISFGASSEFEEEYVNYSYYAVDGNVRFARLTYGGYVTNSNTSIVDYLMDSATKSLTIVWRDQTAKEMKRIRCWYSSTGQVSKIDKYVAGSTTQIESSTFNQLDRNGNTIYSRDAIGQERFYAFANSEYTNSFYKPGMVTRTTSGKSFYEEFLDMDNSDWTLAYGSWSDVSLNWSAIPSMAPTLRMQSQAGHLGLSHSINACPSSILINFTVYLASNAKRSDFRLVYLDYNHPMGMFVFNYQAQNTVKFYHSDILLYSDTITPDIAHKITLYWDYDSTGSLQIYIDGALQYSGNRIDTTNEMRSIFLFLETTSPAPVYYDAIKACTGRTIQLNGLTSGNRVELLDSVGHVLVRGKATSTSLTMTSPVPTDAFPYGAIVVRESDDTVSFVSDSDELWGGDVYTYYSPPFNDGLIWITYHSPLLNDNTKWPYVTLWDDSFSPGAEVNFQWKNDPAMAISGASYHYGIIEPQADYSHYITWSTAVAPKSNDDYWIQGVRLPSSNYPFEIIMEADVVDKFNNHIISSVYWGANCVGTGSYLGPLPAPDQWATLILDISSYLGIRKTGGSSAPYKLSKLTYRVIGGMAQWDYLRWVDGTSGLSRWPNIKINELVGVTHVDFYDVNDKLLDHGNPSPSMPYAISLWCNVALTPDYGTFPVKGYFVMTLSDGTTVRTDTKVIFAGDEFGYSATQFYAYSTTDHSSPANEKLKPYKHLCVGEFSKKGATYATDYSYTYNLYGQWTGSGWNSPSLLNRTKVKTGASWAITYYSYARPYYQLDTVTDPTGLVTKYNYTADWAYQTAETIYKGSGKRLMSLNCWDTSKDLLMNSTDTRGYRTAFEYDLVGRVTKTTLSDRVFEDDFGDNVLTDWTFDTTGGTVTTDWLSGNYFSSAPSMKLSRTSGGNCLAKHPFDVQTGRINASAKIKVSDATKYSYFCLLTASGGVGVYFIFAAGTLAYYDSTGWHYPGTFKYRANVWYYISFDIDTAAKRYSIYVNGTCLTTSANFYDQTSSISWVYFKAGATSDYPITEWVDDVVIQKGKSANILNQYDIYDELDQRYSTKTRDENGHWTQQAMDGLGRVYDMRRLYPDSSYVYSGDYREFDWNGMTTFEERYASHLDSRTSTYYDSLGRPWKIDGDGPSFKTVSYNDAQRSVTSKDEKGRQTTLSYDLAGRLVGVSQPCGAQTISTSYTYDNDGNLLTTRLGTVSPYIDKTHTYDDRDRLTKTVFVGGSTNEYETYAYDNVDRLTEKRMRDGKFAYYAYDSIGWLSMVTYGAASGGPADPTLGKLEYTYDANGNMLSANRTSVSALGAVVKLNYVYDPQNRVRWENYTIDGISYSMAYSYDERANVKQVVYPNGATIDYVRDSYDRISDVKQGPDVLAHFTFDAFDRITYINYLNGATTSHSYNPTTNRLTSSYTSKSGTEILNLAYSYDDSGKITGVTDETYVYDQAGRLWNASGPYGYRNYTYNNLGNIQSMVNYENGQKDTLTYTYDTANGKYRLTQASSTYHGTRSYTYNSKGQVATYTKGSAWTCSYDMDGLMYKAEVVGQRPKFLSEYDALGRRVVANEPADASNGYYTHIFMGDKVAYDPAETMDDCPTCYVYADGLLISKLIYTPTLERNYLHLDHLGSVRKATDASGSVVYSVRYEPYGAPWQESGSENPLGYLGRKMDTTIGWYCLGARFYDPEIGRFMSEDPVLGSLSSPLTLNRYSYCAGDPINRADPNGRFFGLNILVGALIGGIVAAAVALYNGEDVWSAAIGGAIGGAIAGATMGFGCLLSGGISNAASEFVTTAIRTGDLGKAVNAGASGFVSGLITGGLAAGTSAGLKGAFKVAKGAFQGSLKEMGSGLSKAGSMILKSGSQALKSVTTNSKAAIKGGLAKINKALDLVNPGLMSRNSIVPTIKSSLHSEGWIDPSYGSTGKTILVTIYDELTNLAWSQTVPSYE